MAQSIACRAAVMAGDRLNDQEAVGLLERLLKCENRYSCPHGRPTFVRINRADLDRQFGRGDMSRFPIICGPTASGKHRWRSNWQQTIQSRFVSADSRQLGAQS